MYKIVTEADAPNPLHSTRRISPFLVFLVFFILSLVMLFKGLKQLKLNLALADALGIAIIIGVIFGFLMCFPLEKQ